MRLSGTYLVQLLERVCYMNKILNGCVVVLGLFDKEPVLNLGCGERCGELGIPLIPLSATVVLLDQVDRLRDARILQSKLMTN